MPDQVTATKADQRALNKFTNKYLKGVAPLIVDGKRGHATNARVRWVKFYLGYGVSVRANSAEFTAKFRRALGRPKGRFRSRRVRRTAAARRVRQRARARAQRVRATIAPGVTTFDGVPCRTSLVPHLRWAREHGWQGRLVSGWRSPAYSVGLCIRICGRPFCPGRCAGLSSNHVREALDVSDYGRFGQLMARCPHKPRIFNALGAQDPVHFSPNGR